MSFIYFCCFSPAACNIDVSCAKISLFCCIFLFLQLLLFSIFFFLSEFSCVRRATLGNVPLCCRQFLVNRFHIYCCTLLDTKVDLEKICSCRRCPHFAAIVCISAAATNSTHITSTARMRPRDISKQLGFAAASSNSLVVFVCWHIFWTLTPALYFVIVFVCCCCYYLVVVVIANAVVFVVVIALPQVSVCFFLPLMSDIYIGCRWLALLVVFV